MLCAVLVGAVVQNLVGLGLGLVGAPVITLVAPDLMPDVLLWLAVALPLVTLWRDHGDIDWRGLIWTAPTRVVGTVGGVAAIAALSGAALGVMVGVIVLAAVLLTWRAVTVPLNRGTLLGAGLLGGFAGTASSVGGPPMALLYQHSPPQRIRTTLAVYFTTGSALSLGGLALGGQLDATHFWVAVALLPVLLVGTLLGSRVRQRVPAAKVRPAVLVVCAASAIVLLVRSGLALG
ncbi:TSUP family transporter [Nocardioides sp. AX2bis]|uniref:TSUP family transporter n=1 Tax=Nocardioides sp. AX2bis TaxID=2653157 RepID=UPI0012EFB182|nr:TSUP family transporter [Nocardioides sp. AX2bis]VXB46725.1 putative membrane transporter protein [Nocardioides sp. AX2bis]